MIALPLISLLEALLAWALRAFILVLVVGAVKSIGAGVPVLNYITNKISGALASVVHWFADHLATTAIAGEGATTGFLYRVAARLEGFAWSGWYTASRTLEALEILTTSTIPRYVAGALTHTSHLAAGAARAVGALETGLTRDVARLRRYARAIEREAAQALRAAEIALQHAVTGTLPAAMPWVGKRLDALEADWQRLFHRVRSLPAVLGYAAIAAIAASFLARNRMGWLRCSNWNKIGKTGCRMPSRWLDDLLALTADFFVLTNVCTVLPWLEAAASDVGAPLITLLSKAGMGLCRNSAGPPEILPSPLAAGSLPSNPGFTIG